MEAAVTEATEAADSSTEAAVTEAMEAADSSMEAVVTEEVMEFMEEVMEVTEVTEVDTNHMDTNPQIIIFIITINLVISKAFIASKENFEKKLLFI